MKAMLLAAGRGERMGALTQECPKPLLPVAGKPLLRHHLERLAQAGIREVVINTSYRARQIEHFLQQQSDLGLALHVSHEPARLETGGGIHNALPLLGDAPFLLMNGDVWSDYPLQALSLPAQALAYLVLVANPEHNPRGDFAVRGPLAVAEGEPRYTFSGISVLDPRLFRGCAAGRFPLAPLLREAMGNNQVQCEIYQGLWIDVGTPQRLQAVEQLVQEQRQ
ncbi:MULTISPECIES: N-acetylmuramate alpha-1-phosphate uridylyltransferase MurU [unclassified Ketobacter]|mgnify:FL=1|uniref:N-acetylmuramate alpha-1-phosphate uridylyltransferase MurU n=1 Tax=unclassified Ketobacter TaxID=2639109 RepID=UPI000F1DFE39|nr:MULTISPECIES: nucleotidyltransferase family protein [unclassified Ketobacter]MCK5790221.1 nucleotidyltransferase family protein [Ketobacter sp.]RLT87556.1 MAG: nucleotidyltransferase family protein [Ketobacter sp. GenoA1]RLT93302.1 MAG: nucleotidyltransferase family protein [Ketobacter sp.]